LADLGIDGKITLKRILKEQGTECGLDSTDSRYGLVAGFLQHDKKSLSSVKCRLFLEYLCDYYILKEGYVLCNLVSW
jgi:hypothetical protein